MQAVSWNWSCFCLICVTLLYGNAGAADTKEPQAEPDHQQQVDSGRALFQRDWEKEGPIVAKGDGLGPMFNDRSCVACHSQGGVGGSGPVEKNVELVSLIRPRTQTKTLRRNNFIENAKAIHSGFSTQNTNLILHQSGGKGFDDLRMRLLGQTDRRVLSANQPRRKIGGIWIELPQRNSTSLFGAGLIDQIPDSTIISAARIQRMRFPGITGRVPQTASGAVGRFGWRGQMASLRDFVVTACAMELGLQTPDRSQAANPLDPKYTAPGLDLTKEQCDQLTAFVADLSKPERLRHSHLEKAKAAFQGEIVFNKIGCSICHMRDLGPAREIYSDLLLHDMGPGLADSVAAVPEIKRVMVHVPPRGYAGGSFFEQTQIRITTNIHQEWRTPPLWGVRDSAPYLHDGRAANLETAIRFHGGEATRSARAFFLLQPHAKVQVLAFLESLVAPGGMPKPQQTVFGGSSFFSN